MAIGTALAIASGLWGGVKVGKWLFDKMTGGTTKKEPSGSKDIISTSKKTVGGMKTIKTPGGAEITKIPKDDAFSKYMEEHGDEIIKEFTKQPEKFPEITDVMQKQLEAFGPQRELPEMPPEADLKELDFGPIAERARSKFYGETVPTLAERFTSLGGAGQRSSAFQRQLGSAGAKLEEGLAALQAQLDPQYALQKASYGLQRGELGARLGQLGQQQRGQKLREAQFALQHMGAQQAPGQFRKQQLLSLLSGGTAPSYDMTVQPAAPGLMTALAPALGSAVGSLGTLGTAYLGSKLGLFS